VKGVLSGEVVWRAAGQAFRVSPGAHLILDRDEPYLLEIDERQPSRPSWCSSPTLRRRPGRRADAPARRPAGRPAVHVGCRSQRRLWEGPNRLNAGMRALSTLIETDTEPGELDLAVRGLMDGCADLVAETAANWPPRGRQARDPV
jgi:hypothetical protein